VSNFLRLIALLKNSSVRGLPDIALRLRRGDGARHLHTKLSGVTVIFFLL
jgi:hypothetical protein